MGNDKRWTMALAAAMGVGAGILIATSLRGRHKRHAQHREHKDAIKSWENEGGNLAPARTAPVPA